MGKSKHILNCPDHPLFGEFNLLASGRLFRLPRLRARKYRLRWRSRAVSQSKQSRGIPPLPLLTSTLVAHRLIDWKQRMEARIMVSSLQLCDDLLTCWQSLWSCT